MSSYIEGESVAKLLYSLLQLFIMKKASWLVKATHLSSDNPVILLLLQKSVFADCKILFVKLPLQGVLQET